MFPKTRATVHGELHNAKLKTSSLRAEIIAIDVQVKFLLFHLLDLFGIKWSFNVNLLRANLHPVTAISLRHHSEILSIVLVLYCYTQPL